MNKLIKAAGLFAALRALGNAANVYCEHLEAGRVPPRPPVPPVPPVPPAPVRSSEREVSADMLLAWACDNEPADAGALAFQELDWWRERVRNDVFVRYCAEHGPHVLTTNVMLKVSRHLKYYYDGRARDHADFIDRNLNWMVDSDVAQPWAPPREKNHD